MRLHHLIETVAETVSICNPCQKWRRFSKRCGFICRVNSDTTSICIIQFIVTTPAHLLSNQRTSSTFSAQISFPGKVSSPVPLSLASFSPRLCPRQDRERYKYRGFIKRFVSLKKKKRSKACNFEVFFSLGVENMFKDQFYKMNRFIFTNCFSSGTLRTGSGVGRYKRQVTGHKSPVSLRNRTATAISKGSNIKQLLDEVEHDIMNYQNLLSVLSVLIIHDIMRKPNSIIVLLYIFHIIHPQKQKRSVQPFFF